MTRTPPPGETAAAADDGLYEALRAHLDRGPIPFPAAASGVEIRLLRRLFTPDEACITLQLSALPEALSTISRRLGASAASLGPILAAMATRGVIHQTGQPGAERYGKLPFAVGIYELQVGHLTADLERDARAYFDEAFVEAFQEGPTRQMRTVPVGAAFRPTSPVARAADIKASILASAGPFAVQRCICRHGKDLLGEPCRRTDLRENCLTLGGGARFMLARGVAREVTREELSSLVDRADAEGLVLQPQNTASPSFVCCCCGCCCNVLTSSRKLPRPASRFAATHRAVAEAKACSACGACVERCPMEALSVGSGEAAVNHDRCIGCGLCVTSCPSDALRLAERADASAPPADSGALYTRIFRERYGILGTVAALGRHVLGRKT